MMLVMPFASERDPQGARIDLTPVDAGDLPAVRARLLDGTGGARVHALADGPLPDPGLAWWWSLRMRLAKRRIGDCSRDDGTLFQIPGDAIDPAGDAGAVGPESLWRLSWLLADRIAGEYLGPSLRDRLGLLCVRTGPAPDRTPRIHMLLDIADDGDAERSVMPAMTGMVRLIEGTLRYLNGEGGLLAGAISDPAGDVIAQVAAAPRLLYPNADPADSWLLAMESEPSMPEGAL